MTGKARVIMLGSQLPGTFAFSLSLNRCLPGMDKNDHGGKKKKKQHTKKQQQPNLETNQEKAVNETFDVLVSR